MKPKFKDVLIGGLIVIASFIIYYGSGLLILKLNPELEINAIANLFLILGIIIGSILKGVLIGLIYEVRKR